MAKKQDVTIAFAASGDAGTLIRQANFIYCVYQYIGDARLQIVVFGHESDEVNEMIFGESDFIAEFYNSAERNRKGNYDACINLGFYPDVIYEDVIVREVLPKLHELLEYWHSFMKADVFRQISVYHPHVEVNAFIYAINNNRNCVNALDVGGMLGMKRSYEWNLEVKDKSGVLQSQGLIEGEYITLHRGVTTLSNGKESPQTWPRAYYEELIRLLKAVYPDKKIVQLGERNTGDALAGIGVNLLGKTSWKELAIVLKSAWLHIDGECGMVHLRKAMAAGPSVVLFGSTPMEYYGYDDNINIHSQGCKQWCARLVRCWQERCYRGYDIPPCMAEITPDMVLDRIVGWERIIGIKRKGIGATGRVLEQ